MKIPGINKRVVKVIGATVLACVIMLALFFAVPIAGNQMGDRDIPGLKVAYGAYCVDREIDMDIEPDDERNIINLGSHGTAEVAVLCECCDPDIDPETVTFEGATPVSWRWEDIDGDECIDLIFEFNIQDLEGLNVDSVSGKLIGQTYDGRWVVLTDDVTIE